MSEEKPEGGASPESKPESVPIPRFNEVIHERNELRTELKELREWRAQREAEAEQRKTEEQVKAGQFKEAEEGYKARIAELEKDSQELGTLREELSGIKKANREALIAKLPEDRREYASKLPDELLPDYVEQNIKKSPHFDMSKPSSGGLDGEITMEQIRKLPKAQQEKAYQEYLTQERGKLVAK